jgi:hypothetical protein
MGVGSGNWSGTGLARHLSVAAVTTPVAALLLSACGGSHPASATTDPADMSCAGFQRTDTGERLRLIDRVLDDNGYPADSLTIQSTLITIDGYCAINGGRARLGTILPEDRPVGQEADR